jgi:hypothetical protein
VWCAVRCGVVYGVVWSVWCGVWYGVVWCGVWCVVECVVWYGVVCGVWCGVWCGAELCLDATMRGDDAGRFISVGKQHRKVIVSGELELALVFEVSDADRLARV